MTLPTETRLNSPEMPMQAKHNLSNEAETSLAIQLPEAPEKTRVKRIGQESSIELTLTNETMLNSTEKSEEAEHNIPDKADQFLSDQLSEDPEAGCTENTRKPSTEVALTNGTELKSPEKLEPTDQNIPNRTGNFLKDQLSARPEETGVGKVNQKTSIKSTLPDGRKPEGPEKLEEPVQNTPERADKSLTEQLSKDPEAMGIDKVSQDSSTKVTSPNETVPKSTQEMQAGEKSFACTTCDKTFGHEENTKKHEKFHTEEKPLLNKPSLSHNSSCTTCDKTFKNNDEMEQHEKLHTEEKPIDKISLQSDSLKNIRNHTPVKSYMKPT